MAVKYVFVTGGVVSGLGKGITAASLGRLLKARGYTVTMQKFDPYINIDPGTMNPVQHGEVFVTDDGAETDLDLGHYERFIDESLSKNSNVTTGKIYWSVLQKERRGDFGGSVVITKYNAQESAELFKNRLEKLGIKVYRHYLIPGYPTNVPFIVSDDGYGKNDYIETSRPLVVVTAPGPGSGKMAVCLSQLYHEHKHGIKAGYAKFETFPIWNIPLKHPVNLAYEAATADLNDINMIDPFHLEAYGETTINYNRDVEIFPVLNAMFQRIYGESPYKSPTDMGVNMAGNCICNDDACRNASCQEIIRRYYASRRRLLLGACSEEETYKLEMLMNQADITVHDRPVVDAALTESERTGGPAAALELPDGSIVTGKTSDLLGACSALLLNALKELAGIGHEIKIISPQAIEPIQSLKTKYLGSRNPRLHTDEVLIALSVSAATSEDAKLAMEQLPKLKGCQAHVSVMPGSVDIKQFKLLSIQATFEAKYEKNSVFFNNKGV
jgi:uncharacterized protein (UPF0371 family)